MAAVIAFCATNARNTPSLIATVAELETVLVDIESHKGAAYIEVMIPDEESQPLPEDVIDRGYKLRTPR